LSQASDIFGGQKEITWSISLAESSDITFRLDHVTTSAGQYTGRGDKYNPNIYRAKTVLDLT